MKRIIYLSGGFGNQLFQIMAAAHLSSLNFNVFIDTSLVERNFITEKLLGWKIHGNFVEQNFAQNFRFGKRPQINVLYDLAILSLSNALNGRVFSHEFVRTERNFIHPDAKIIMGYFQNLRMYSSDQFERYLKLLETIISSKSLQNRTVIHFRWGDSDWAKKHSSYYSKVFEIAKNINKPVKIVTDDELNCKRFLQNYDLKYTIESNDVLSDFDFLANSKVIFTAPSTFSWWAAILRNNKKEIYMPKFFEERFVNTANINYL